MHSTSRTKWQLRLVNLSFVLLFLITIGLLLWVSREYRWQFDLTQNQRHSLAPASIAVAQRLNEPLTVTVYADQRGQTRQIVQDIISRYQVYKSDLQLNFVDPDLEPDRVRAAEVQMGGEVLFEYGGARERLPLLGLNEEVITNALIRLGHRGERWLVFLSGHGERSPDRQANFDLSTWAAQLQKQGFTTRALSLGEHPQIPENTTALIIAGPRTRLLSGEIKEIQNYLNRGGNLLWLSDPGPLNGLEPVAELLGVEFQPGVIVDGTSETLTGDATALVLARYGGHPTVRNFVQATVFPRAHGLNLRAPEGWNEAVLLDTRPEAWAETGTLTSTLSFDKGKDIKGPLTIAAALTREHDNREQRVVVVGDGDFLSNSVIANVGNLDLGMSLINWLSQDEAFVDIPIGVARDRSLNLTRPTQATIAIGFLFVLPIGLATFGISIWWRRRRR